LKERVKEIKEKELASMGEREREREGEIEKYFRETELREM
jgi:hypothetical protein